MIKLSTVKAHWSEFTAVRLLVAVGLFLFISLFSFLITFLCYVFRIHVPNDFPDDY